MHWPTVLKATERALRNSIEGQPEGTPVQVRASDADLDDIKDIFNRLIEEGLIKDLNIFEEEEEIEELHEEDGVDTVYVFTASVA